jgi:hypothetical protein
LYGVRNCFSHCCTHVGVPSAGGGVVFWVARVSGAGGPYCSPVPAAPDASAAGAAVWLRVQAWFQ